ncbi:unnamed protein product [Tilletia caries]|nr:unnamed protein product [Tilletia caries]
MRFSLTTAALALFALGASSTVSARPRALQKEGSQRAAPRVVQVHVHVVYSGTTGKIPLAPIQQQIAVLNSDFSQANYRFNLASTTYTDNPAWYDTILDETTRSGLDMKKALYRGGKADLNMYYNTLFNPKWKDGIVLHTPSLPSDSDVFAPYNLGRTASHEVGHCPFQGETCASFNPGDFISDTPLQSTPSFGCPTSKNTCSAPGEDSIHNFMDYGDDVCKQLFTSRQVTRMRALSLLYRGI